MFVVHRPDIQTSVSYQPPKQKWQCLRRWIGNNEDSSWVVEPYSRVFTIWNFAVIFSFGYNLFYVPMGICYNYEAYDGLLALDILSILVNIIDILMRSNSAILNEEGDIIKDRVTIWSTYANNGLIIDTVSAVPIDYIAYAIGSPIWARAWARCFRLLKGLRVYDILNFLSKNTKSSMTLYKLGVYFIMFIYLNHFAACFMFYIGKI